MRRSSLVVAALSAGLLLVLGNSASAARKDPFLAFCFKVTLTTPTETTEAFFKSVSGLESEVEVTDYREGGVNDTTHKLVGATKWKNIVLKRGFTGFSPNDPVQTWARQVMGGQDVRKEVTITLLDADLHEAAKIQFTRCVVVKWDLGAFASPRDPSSSPRDPQPAYSAPFDAEPGQGSVETIEIAHEGMRLPQ
jgi:phage tail-like protein